MTVPPIDRTAALAELADSSTGAARLAELAHAFPDLGSEISAHPNVYPDLITWLQSYGSFTDGVPAAAPVEPPSQPTLTEAAQSPGAGEVLTHPGLFAGFTFAAASALAVALLGFIPFTQTFAGIPQLFSSGSSDGGEDYDTYDEGASAATQISCPSGSSAVMWAEWDGGATLVCQFSSGGLRMIVASGGTIRESDDVTSTPTGYSSPLADIAFGGWSLWLPDSGGSIAATSWGNDEWGEYSSDEAGAADDIPSCPSDSYPISLSLWSGGWLLTCGTSDGAATSFEYRDGSDTGSGGALTYAGGRYCGTTHDGLPVCVSSSPSVVQFGNGGDGSRYTVEANYFAESGPGGPGEGTGAYGVDAPGETAAEQVGYLVAILEKSGEARAMVNSVLAPLNACSVSATDVQNLQILTQARTDLLAALRSTPVDQVPDGANLLAQLTNAIELSEQADIGYVNTAQQMANGDCSASKATYRAAITIADQAEVSKQAFVNAWNAGIATQFGVRTFTAKDI